MQALAQLASLNVSMNRLAALPVWLASMRSLAELWCVHCPLVGVEVSAVASGGSKTVGFDALAAWLGDPGLLRPDVAAQNPLRLVRTVQMHFAPRTPLRERCVTQCVALCAAQRIPRRLEVERLPLHIQDAIADALG
eukprot:TRINITY_DN2390_c0_g1_i2.p2 TRINITY_DN2390_c0_g1~~TRINITY_DN2390_c0_g1_i2.p2  ORF type:complete len:137 (+),score=21.68 TRINITY_DN2390_c0_g1_i2:926-1336(+)